MSCSDNVAICIDGVSKYFEIYEKPAHRLLQMIFRGHRQYYRPFWALHDISFEVKRGECVGIIGDTGPERAPCYKLSPVR